MLACFQRLVILVLAFSLFIILGGYGAMVFGHRLSLFACGVMALAHDRQVSKFIVAGFVVRCYGVWTFIRYLV